MLVQALLISIRLLNLFSRHLHTSISLHWWVNRVIKVICHRYMFVRLTVRGMKAKAQKSYLWKFYSLVSSDWCDDGQSRKKVKQYKRCTTGGETAWWTRRRPIQKSKLLCMATFDIGKKRDHGNFVIRQTHLSWLCIMCYKPTCTCEIDVTPQLERSCLKLSRSVRLDSTFPSSLQFCHNIV